VLGGMLRSSTALSAPTSTPSSKVVEQDKTLTSPARNRCWMSDASSPVHWAVCSRALSETGAVCR